MVKYMGCNIRLRKDGMKLNKENLIAGKDGNVHSLMNFDRKEYEKNAQKSFDVNMNYFSKLSHNSFEKELSKFLSKHNGFKEYKDLNELNNIMGYYLMVLDVYSQVYIGSTGNIKQRILSHWSKQMDVDRLVFGNVDNSILSINSFRAFDTTRVFAMPSKDKFKYEDEFIESIDKKYILNRTVGGLQSFDEAIAKGKGRNFSNNG